MADSTISIRVTATGAAEASKVLDAVAKSGAQLGGLTAGGAAKAEQALNGLGASAQKAAGLMSQAGISTGLFGQALGALTSPLGLAAAGFAALGLAVHTATESMVRNFEEVRRLQAVSGLSADAADNLADTFQLLGFKSDVLTTALVKMAQEVDSGGKGLAKLGVTIADLEGKVEGDTFLMLRDRISNLGTAGERSAAGMALFGRGFRELAPLFAMSSAEFEKFQARADKYSKWTEESAELTHRFITSGNALTLMFDGIAQEIGAALLPGLTKANETLGDWIDAARDVLRVPIAAAWAVISSVAVGLWNALKPLAEVLWQLAKVILPPVVAIIGGALIAGLVALQAALIPITGTFVFLSEILKGNFTGAVKVAGDAMAAQLTNIDETLAKSKVLGDTLSALARGEVIATEDVTAAKEKASQKNAALDAIRLGAAQAALQVQQATNAASLALDEAYVKQRVALHQGDELDLVAFQQHALDAKAAALQASFGLEMAIAKQSDDLTGKAVAAVRAKYITAFNDIAVARVDLSTKILKAVADEMHAEFQAAAALTNGPASSTQPLLDAMAAWSNLGIAIDKINEAAKRDGDEMRRLADSITTTRDALEDLAARFGDTTDDAEKMRVRLHGLLDEMMRLQTFRATAETVAEAWSFVTDASSGATIALGDYSTAVGIAEQESQMLGKGLGDELSAKIAITEQAILKAAKAFGVESDAVKVLQERLAGLKVSQFIDDMNQIAALAALLGNRFDGAGTEISRFQKLLVDKLKDTNNVITPEVEAIAAQLNGMIDAKKLNEALGLSRTVFDDFVDAARGTASAMHAGFSDGFFALFTGEVKTLGDVFANFGKSMLRVLTDFLASQAVKGLLSLFEWLIGGLSGSFDGGGLIGSILAGAGALIAKFSGGGGASADVAGSITDAAGDALSGVTKSASGTASALNTATSGVTNFSAAVSAGLSAIGVGLGVFSLAKGGSAGSMALSAGGTALSAYSLAVSISQILANQGIIAATSVLPTISVAIAQGLAALAPGLAASIGTSLSGILSPAIVSALGALPAGTAIAPVAGGAVSAFSSAISSILESITPFLEVLSGIAAPLAIAGAFLSIGLDGMAADAQDAADQFKGQFESVQYAMNEATKAGVIFADLGHQLDASHLVGTLHLLHDAVRDLGNLDLATGLNQLLGDEGAASITNAIPAMRASVGAAWLAALDAAFKQGLDLTPGGAPNSLGETLASPMRLGRGGLTTTQGLLGAVNATAGDATDAAIKMLAHVLEITNEQAAAFIPAFNDWVSGNGSAPGMAARIGDEFWNSFMTPEHMAQLQGRGVITATNEGSPNSNMLDIDAINKLLDTEFLTTTVRNAVVDAASFFGISKDQLGAVGAGEGNWRGTPGAGDMPSMSAIAGVQAALDAAGFKPGEYAAALEKFLLSIDANIVNNPAWEKFTKALHGGGDVDAITGAINAAIAATMTPKTFYETAKKFTDKLTDDIKAAMEQQASMIAAGADQAQIDAVGKLIAAMQEGIKAYAGMVQLFTAIPGEMASITGDLQAQTDAAIAAWQVAVQSLGDNIQAAQEAFDKALTGGNIVEINATAQQLHDATINGYNMMLKAVESINAAIAKLLDQSANLVAMVTSVAQYDITASGSFGTITSLLGALQSMAETGSTAAQRMWAVDQALRAIAATLPTAITKFANLDKDWWLSHGPQSAGQLQADWPSKITGSVVDASAPFRAAQQTAIDQASGGEKLALLQQQASNFNALASAAIAGVQQWATQAIAGARAAADEVIAGLAKERDAQLTAIDLTIKDIQSQATIRHDERMAEIADIQDAAKLAHDARMAQIDAIQASAQAEAEMRAAQMDALREQITKAQELESAIEGMGKFIDQLKQGPLGPGNTGDKATMAQDAFAKALQAYNAHPTAAGLTGLQGLAQTMLSLKETVLTKPNPVFQALAATTIKQLEAAEALAAGQMSDSETLKAQLAALQDLDKAAAQGVKDQIAAIQAADKKASEKADAQIAAIQALDKQEQAWAQEWITKLTEQKTKITEDFETQTAAIEAAFKTQKLAIEKAAQDEIDGIQKALADELKKNFDQQVPLLKAQFDAANAQLAAIGDVAKWGDATVKKLEEIRLALAGALVGATTKGDAAFKEGTTGGRQFATEGIVGGGLPGNSGLGGPGGATHWTGDPITPPAMGKPVVSPGTIENPTPVWDPYAGTGITPSNLGLNDWTSPWNQPRDLSKEGVMWGGPNAAKLNALELSITQMQANLEAQIAHNQSWVGGKLHRNFSPEQLATMQTTLAAQIAAIRAQQQVLISSTPPPGMPGAKTPPYTPPGPAWLSRTPNGAQTQGGVMLVIEQGAIVISGVSDPEKAAELAVKKVEDSVKNGRIGTLVDQRVRSAR